MKTGILTYYGVHNHGAVLQANALKKVLEEMGCEVSFLSFSRNYDMIPQNEAKKYKIGLSSLPFYIKYAFKKGINNIFFNIRKNKLLKKYRGKNLPLGNRYSDFEGDLVVIGSDEVFSFDVGINPFFYGHAIKAKKIISYAGSFGATNLDFIKTNRLDSIVISGFSSLFCVGVRDANSKLIADELADCKSTIVCDPVILYGYEKEQELFVPKEKDFIVVYAYDKNMNSREEVDKIKAFAKGNHLKLYSVGYHHKWCHKNINATPEELLGYIKKAKLVITDTFHGSVMSLICNSNFIVKLRGNQNKLGFLLSEYGVEDRIINSFDEIGKVFENEINYNEINRTIERRREISKEFLLNAIRK
ncbi:MAG: hypothetical protein DBX97_03085 [Collinsella tanakaei]|nr:MAG: hypothetical protein DBX97_03085 [Collinsella tanakaei]